MRLALAQLSPSPLLVKNDVTRLNDLMTQAGAHQADLLLTPEMSLQGYECSKTELLSQAIALSDPSCKAIQQLCQRHQIALVLGYAEKDRHNNLYNSALFINKSGKIEQNYRKTHLYSAIDKNRFLAGERLLNPVHFMGFNIGLAICYDVEFPELVRWHRQQSVDLLLVPTANMDQYTDVATKMVPTRAAENGIFLGYANYTGFDKTLQYCGHSSICGPLGQVLAQAKTAETLIYAEISTTELDQARRAQPYFTDRRPEIYQPPSLK